MSPATAEGTEDCELHIWPSKGLAYVTHGMWDGFQPGSGSSTVGGVTHTLIAEAPQSRIERSDQPASTVAANGTGPLNPAEQSVRLRKLALGDLVGLQHYRSVVHDAPLDNRMIRATPGRYAETAASCYADLLVDDLVYSREWANGRKLKSFIRFRDFGAAASAKRSFGTWVQTDLESDPVEHPEQQDLAIEESRAAFDANLAQFVQYLSKASKKAARPKKGD
jgi:hypothetical protein